MRITTLCLLALMSTSAFAEGVTFSCTTTNGERDLEVSDSKIVFIEEGMVQNSKKVMISENSLRHEFKMNGNFYTLHIENINQLDATRDFLEIQGPKGHNFTNALHCSKK